MKKLLFLLVFCGGAVYAQVPAQDVDSLIRPGKTDSADFSSPAFKKDSTSGSSPSQPARRDSLPVDDRKPKSPGKK